MVGLEIPMKDRDAIFHIVRINYVGLPKAERCRARARDVHIFQFLAVRSIIS